MKKNNVDKKFKDFWLKKSKEEIIDAYIECINNGEVLLRRIEKAIPILKKFSDKKDVLTIIEILEGSEDDEC